MKHLAALGILLCVVGVGFACLSHDWYVIAFTGACLIASIGCALVDRS